MAKEKYQNKYRIASARLKNYDYASNGEYFITIVTKNRKHFFGEIVDGKMVLNEIGEISKKYWNEIPQHFSFIKLDEMVVMPNHIHGILWIDNDDAVGDAMDDAVGGRDVINRVSTCETQKTGGITGKNNPMFYDNISRVVRWYKGRCSFEINKIYGKSYFAWQSRFHDRIIRNKNVLNRIREYIRKNPEMWQRDRDNGDLS